MHAHLGEVLPHLHAERIALVGPAELQHANVGCQWVPALQDAHPQEPEGRGSRYGVEREIHGGGNAGGMGAPGGGVGVQGCGIWPGACALRKREHRLHYHDQTTAPTQHASQPPPAAASRRDPSCRLTAKQHGHGNHLLRGAGVQPHAAHRYACMPLSLAASRS
jgi:hypothetical protein